MRDPLDLIRNHDCTLCPLWEEAEEVCSMGTGPTSASVAVVTDTVGLSGGSSRLLEKSLRELAGLELSQLYITSAVKCPTPENRAPERKEVKTCSTAYLFRELELVNPKYVLTLGNAAMQALVGKSGITKHHGDLVTKFFDSWRTQVFPTLHPSAVLRNPKYAQAFAADIHRFGQIVSGEDTSPTTNVRIVRNAKGLRALRRLLMAADRIAFDIETYVNPANPPLVRTNMQEWHGADSRIVSISFSWREGLSVVLILDHDRRVWNNVDKVLAYLKPALERGDCEYIAHNLKFDARWLAAKGIRIPHSYDTMLAAHLIDENQPKGLKPLSRTWLGAGSYDIGLRNAAAVPVPKLALYNGRDTDYTLRLRRILGAKLDEEETSRRIFDRLMMPASEALMDVELRGIWIDPSRWKARHDEAIDKRDQLYDYINRFVPEHLRPINLNSPAQVSLLLFDELGLPVINRTAKGAPSTAESTLLRLATQHKVPMAMIKYRKWAKYLSTYLLPWWFEHMGPDGRIRSWYKLFGTVTGRLSGEGGIQQVPRDPFIRSLLGAPPGWKFVQADYSQVELRIAAMISGDEAMLSQYARGEDIHMIRAMRMTGKLAEDVDKEERKKAKAVNFGYIYGMGAQKFVLYAFDNYGLKVSLEEAEKDRNGFFDDYPMLLKWHARQRALAQKYHRVSSPLGRIRHLTNIMSQEKGIRGEAERQAINSPVQSTASDLMLFALVNLHGVLPPDEAFIVGTVHDSILFQIRDEHIDEYCTVIKRTMEDMAAVERAFHCTIDVPIIADVEVGQHWGEGTEWVPS